MDCRDVQDLLFSHARYRDRLIADTEAIGVTFEDHPELQGFVPLEWSHLRPDDRATYTQARVNILYAEIDRRRKAQARAEHSR